ncbi:MAG: monomethylamine:corrinoid methyltransferase [Lachnospiraceae bacterium]|nr:monomethylamine:corrinoid methyltransferase [Candidatus Equihabitans merdae]
MKSHTRLLTVLDRMDNGVIMEEKDFDKLISKTVRKLIKKYDLKFNREDAILYDDDMADRFFQAAMELAVTTGVYCTDTHSAMMFSREEIEQALRWAPDHVTYGTGLDQVTVRHRVPEDPRVPVICGGGFGTPIPEEWFSTVMEAYAKEPIVDTIVGCNFYTTHGRVPKTRSPWEVLLAWREIELTKAALQRAGRPGLGVGVVENAVSEIGEISGSSADGFDQHHWHHTCFVSELKTNYGLLIKVAHLVKTGCIIHSFYNSILGGYAGGPEGVVICSCAGIIMECVVNMATTFSICPTHPFYNCDTAPELVWAASAVQQAINRNTHLCTTVMTSPVSGPMTESLLYECAAMSTAATVSGAARIDGVRSAVGVEILHVTGLEVRFNGECAHAAAGLSRKDANEMIKEFEKGYIPVLDKKPIGKSFLEAYDPIKVEPTQEWLDMYNKVKENVERIGLKMKY